MYLCEMDEDFEKFAQEKAFLGRELLSVQRLFKLFFPKIAEPLQFFLNRDKAQNKNLYHEL